MTILEYESKENPEFKSDKDENICSDCGGFKESYENKCIYCATDRLIFKKIMEKYNLKTWLIEAYTNEQGQEVIVRTNDGFNAAELLGICEFSKHEIIQQMQRTITPDIIERKVIK